MSNQYTGATPAVERFWPKVKKTETCWLWLGAKKTNGYGRIRNGRDIYVHRFAYELLVGTIPKGLTIDHLCRNRACVNPAHLEAITNKDNILRGKGLSAREAQRTHCPYGHPYDLFNTYHYRRGGQEQRQCRQCHNRRVAATRRSGHNGST